MTLVDLLVLFEAKIVDFFLIKERLVVAFCSSAWLNCDSLFLFELGICGSN